MSDNNMSNGNDIPSVNSAELGKITQPEKELTIEEVSLQAKMEQLKEFLHENNLVLVPKLSYKEFGVVPEITVGIKNDKSNDTVQSA